MLDPVRRLIHQGWFWMGAGVILFSLVVVAVVAGNAEMNAWVKSDHLRELLNRETSKGLKLDGNYAPLTRVGWLGMQTGSFTGTNGQKVIVKVEAQDISGWFNPLGIALHRWQVDDIHIKRGTVMIQKTEGSGKKSPGMPWWGLFWPYRVQLQDVKVADADALFLLKDKEAGIYHTVLEITPNGHDFEYDARGGEFRTPLSPPLVVQHLHMLIRKPKLTCEEFLLGDDPAHPEEQLRMTGEAGLQEDRSIKVAVDLTSLKLSPWLPEKLRAHVSGEASGHLDYASTGTGMETADARGHVQIVNGLLHELAPVRHYIALTGSPDPGDLSLKVCQTDVSYKEGALAAENLKVECEGVFRLEGTLRATKDGALTGEMQLGLTDPYLSWLPTARSAIFTRDDGPYHFATVHFSGTTQKPQQDLTDRVTKEVEKSPKTELKLFFHAASNWFDLDAD
jgi:hypothetical protein